MNSNKIHDFIIIGCGMAGASLAYELSKQSSKVLVLEAEAYPAYHTTGRSAAFYMEAYGNDTVRKITQASRAFYDKPPNNFSETPLLLPCGALYIGNDRQAKAIQQKYEQLVDTIENCQRVDHAFIKQRIHLLHDSIQHGIWEPASMEIDVAALMAGYTRLAKQAKVNFQFHSPVQTLERKSGIWHINGCYQARTIINAAGAWADHVVELAKGRGLGLVPKKRNICIAKVDARYGSVRDWPLCVDIDEQFYFKPSGEHLLVTPADEIPCEAHDAQADEFQIALGLDRIQEVLDMKFTHVQRQWAGLRTFSEDKSPALGFDPLLEDFFWLAGQGGYGIQMAPALAKLSAGLLTEHSDLSIDGLDINKLAPERLH